MGSHTCEYITREQAQKMNLRNLDDFDSSGETIMEFSSGRTWIMPDMVRLVVSYPFRLIFDGTREFRFVPENTQRYQ